MPLIESVIVSTESFIEPGRQNLSIEECYQFCMDVNVYATILMDIGFRDHELSKPLVHIFYATELLIRTEPCDEIIDFLIEIKWSQKVIQEVIEALEAIGADLHARFLSAIHLHIKNCQHESSRISADSVSVFIDNALEEFLSDEALRQRYPNLDEGDRRWQSICFHCVKYMEDWTNIKTVPGGAHNQSELQKYFKSSPAILSRLKQIKKNDPVGLEAVLSIDKDEELLFASHNGHLEILNSLISANANVNGKAPNGSTPLSLACEAGHLEAVRALLAANASVNAKCRGGTALMAAVSSPHLGQLSERLEVIRTLLAAGADVNAKEKDGDTALIVASGRQCPEIVELLLAANADANAKLKNGVTALSLASSRGHLKVVEALIRANADVNAKTSNGETPLISASRGGCLDVVQALLAAKADVDAALSRGHTALFLASSDGHLAVVEALVAANAKLDAQRYDGVTALMIAAQRGHQNVVEFLNKALCRRL
jgi:ankyrin repeat protein